MDTRTLVYTVLRTSGQEIPYKFMYQITTGTQEKTKTFTSLLKLFFQDSKIASLDWSQKHSHSKSKY